MDSLQTASFFKVVRSMQSLACITDAKPKPTHLHLYERPSFFADAVHWPPARAAAMPWQGFPLEGVSWHIIMPHHEL